MNTEIRASKWKKYPLFKFITIGLSLNIFRVYYKSVSFNYITDI